ncbi:DUF805 domain-containing protein [Macrococcus equipercicus]|uniref:DUF805 domain-containing protein n=1 Tax=Macrococcus equipercicus TaxID=69967 RepID=A0A9Q9F2C6_9STAP|nr:DUF805 domain-containing protein [Macrococcus equipercicus]UTH14650.1 DUF805 domain-containing protein [Macrococcus equipercicus]
MQKIPMNPLEAYISYWKNTFNMSGRARRKEYWWSVLFNSLITVLISCLLEALHVKGTANYAVTMILAVIFLVPDFSVTVRRFHDNGLSGKWAVPMFALTLIAIFFPDFGESELNKGVTNDYINNTIVVSSILLFITLLGYFIFMIFTMMKEGEQGTNQYGDDPKHSR